MRLDVKGMAVALGLTWGLLAMFATGFVNMVWSGYGGGFLAAMSSLYPGFHPDGSVGQLLLGTAYGLADGAVLGAFVAWLYNLAVGHGGAGARR